MTARNIMKAALAHCYEEADKDILTKNLTLSLINLGVAELTDAENAIRANDCHPVAPLSRANFPVTEPPVMESLNDNVPYDYKITTILLPLWLAWKVYEGLEEYDQAAQYRQLYEVRRSELIPAVFEQMCDRNTIRWC